MTKYDLLARGIAGNVVASTNATLTNYYTKSESDNITNGLDSDITNLETNVTTNYALKSEVTNSLTPKGKIAYASLPTTGNTVGDYYYCSDGDGTNGAGNYVWNGTIWYFGGTGDDGYGTVTEELQEYKDDMLSLELDYNKELFLSDFEAVGQAINIAYTNNTLTYTNSVSTKCSGVICKARFMRIAQYSFFVILAKGYDTVNQRYSYLTMNFGSKLGKLYRFTPNTTDSTQYVGNSISIAPSSTWEVIVINNNDFTTLIINGVRYDIDFKAIQIIEGSATNLSMYTESCIGTINRGIIDNSLKLDDESRILFGNINKSEKGNYIAFGDSITYGALTDSSGNLIGQSTIRYPEYYGQRHNMNVVNKGVGGQGYLKSSYGYTALQSIQSTDISNADLITLAYGLNDERKKNTYLGTLNADNLGTILGQLNACLSYIWTQKPTVKIIVIGTTTRLGEYEEPILVYGDRTSEFNTQGLNIALETFCKNNGVDFISNDGNGINEYNPSLRTDITHLTEEGYEVLSKYLSAKIASCYQANENFIES